MSEEIINHYKNQINVLEKKIEFIEKILKNQDQINKELEKQNKMIESHYEILNIIMSNKFIKANGVLRNLQLHVLELLKFIDNICKKYGLTYWLDFGTLLGAIRHEGFIPWDDEIDLAMPRKDYEELIKVLPDEIKRFEGLENKLNVRKGSAFFKNAELSPGTPTPVLQFINKNPHAGLEIYPIEYIGIDEDNLDLNYYSRLFIEIRNEFRNKYSNNIYSYSEGFMECESKMNVVSEKTEYMACSADGANRKIIRTNDVFPLKKCNFEDLEVNIPNNPKNYLSTYYQGDIMDIPKNIKNHSFVTEYIKKEGKNKDLDQLYEEELSFWRNINNLF